MSIGTNKPCANPTCGRPAVNKYCGAKCSAAVRNRRYYRTINGRLKKRAAASRYFQQHKQELYDKRTARMQQSIYRLFQQDMAHEMALYKLEDPFLIERLAERTMQNAKRITRFNRDFHPREFKNWRTRYQWMLDFDGQLRPYLVRGPYREEVTVQH